MESFSQAHLCPPEILEIILRSLDYTTAKNFRLVCRHWNIVAKPYLANLSKICLSPSPKNLEDFKANFGNFRFSSFKFQGDSSDSDTGVGECVGSELNAFLAEWRPAVKALEFHRVSIQVDEWDNGEFRICPILQSGLETLILDCSMTTPISVKVEYLANVKVLKLTGGAVLKYNKHLKLLPTIIELRDTTFQNEYVHLNDFINFRQAKKVCLHQGNTNTNELLPIELTLDMSEAITLDDLDLKRIKIKEMGEANWEITGLLSLSHIPWRWENQMLFTNLHFQNEVMDASRLPETVEYIGLTDDIEEEEYIMRKLMFESFVEVAPNLINLKFLSLNHITNFPAVFKNCPNLKNINFYGGISDEKIGKGYFDNILADHLPRNLSKMHIKPKANIYSSSNIVLNVDTLIVNGFIIPSCLKRLGEVVSCKNLMMILNHVEPNLPRLINNIHNLQENIYHKDTVVYIGPVKRSTLSWLIGQVDTSSLDIPNALSSNSAEYYFSFENKVGTTVSKVEFDQLSTFSHGHIHLPNYSASASTLPLEYYH